MIILAGNSFAYFCFLLTIILVSIHAGHSTYTQHPESHYEREKTHYAKIEVKIGKKKLKIVL
jgi:hypothetical protein